MRNLLTPQEQTSIQSASVTASTEDIEGLRNMLRNLEANFNQVNQSLQTIPGMVESMVDNKLVANAISGTNNSGKTTP